MSNTKINSIHEFEFIMNIFYIVFFLIITLIIQYLRNKKKSLKIIKSLNKNSINKNYKKTFQNQE